MFYFSDNDNSNLKKLEPIFKNITESFMDSGSPTNNEAGASNEGGNASQGKGEAAKLLGSEELAKMNIEELNNYYYYVNTLMHDAIHNKHPRAIDMVYHNNEIHHYVKGRIAMGSDWDWEKVKAQIAEMKKNESSSENKNAGNNSDNQGESST